MNGRSLMRLVAAQVCLHSAMTGARLAAPLLALQQGHSAATVGMLLALFALTQLFLALPAGRLADRRGLRRPLALSVGAATLGAALPAIWLGLPALGVAALLTGAAAGTAQIALQRHVGRSAHGAGELKKVFSWMAIAPAGANFVGPFLAGVLIDHAGPSPGHAIGFRVAFGAMALFPLAAWWLARNVPETPLTPPAADAPRRRVRDLLALPLFRRLLFVNWLQAAAWDVHSFVLPILGHERGYGAATIGAILGAFAVAAAVVRLLLPLLAARVTERSVIHASALVTAIVFLFYPLMPSALLMGACSVVLGLALGAVQPMVMSLLHQMTPPARHGEAMALRIMTINSSSFAMPMLFGAVGAATGVAALFWIMASVLALGSKAIPGLRLDGVDAHPVS